MFVKLQYTSAKPYAVFLRVLADIINTTGVTNVATLQTRMTDASYHSSLTSNFDATYSSIVRTTPTTNETAHIARPASAVGTAFEFVLRQKVYDAATNYYVSVYSDGGGSNGSTAGVGTAITNPMSSSEWAVTEATNGTTALGTTIGLTSISGPQVIQTYSLSQSAYTLWAYISDTAFIFAFNNGGYSALGFNTTANQTNSNYSGPHMFMQYTRRDYYNTDANGFIPVVFNNTNRTYGGLGQNGGGDMVSALNPLSVTNTECPFMVYNYLAGIVPTNSLTWSLSTAGQVSWGVGSRYSDVAGMYSSGGNSTANVVTYGTVFTTTVQARIFSTDFTSRVYPLYPLSFRRPGTLGGNITDRTEIYLFHGDYAAGDEIVFNSKTYVLLPIYGIAVSYRLAWAIPKA